ncbi:MAG: antibiotic biosynthesis monooxygenase [Proteobacteria bacterium]|nr:antibiotic biosynthesis monooxygenase [Pseudomonadota bacterium]
MFVVIVEFDLHPERFEDFKARVQIQAEESLDKEDECHIFDVCIEPTRPNSILLYEIYGSAEAFQIHLESNHFKAFDAEVAPWITSKQVRQFERLER